MAELKGNKYGTHRVIEPKGVLTQAAWKIDNDMSKVYSNEIVCDVTSLNIDSASFTQISEACGGDEKKIGEMILGIVAERGKQQNPVTGSGGMFKGVVAHIGEDLKKKPGFDLKEGDKIVSLVSLSMTPCASTRSWPSTRISTALTSSARPSCSSPLCMPRCPMICPSLWPWLLWTWPALPRRPASCPTRVTAS